MDFELSEEQKMFRSMVRDFCVKEIEPLSAQIDETGEFPAALVKKAADLGLFGIAMPEEYGGSGGDYVAMAIVCEELSRASGSMGAIYLAGLSLSVTPVLMYGTPEQKEKFLTPIATGEKIACSV